MKTWVFKSIPLLFLVLSSCYPSLKVGSGYQKQLGAEEHSGHAIVFFLGTGKCEITVKQKGTIVDEFVQTVNTFSIVPLRLVGEKYDIVYNFEYNFLSTTYRGSKTFTFESKKGIVHGAFIQVTPRLLSGSFNSETEEFKGKVAQEIMNPSYQLFIWDDLVKRNKSSDNIAVQKSLIDSNEKKDITEKLKEIKSLYDNGLISQEEYEDLRANLIKEL